MKAMILAAGEGTRLRPLTLTVPKPMVPIVGRPLLSWTFSWLARHGVTDAVINLYHRPQAIPDFFGTEYSGIRLHYLFEEKLLGTAGGVKAAADLLGDAPFFVIYGDNLIDADLGRLRQFHDDHDGVATVALFPHPNPSAAGIVATDATGRITRFVEKPPPAEVFTDTANAGVYVLNPSVLDFIPSGGPSDFGHDIFPSLLHRDMALYGTPLNGYLQDTGTPDQYRKANWDALGGHVGISPAKGESYCGEKTRVSPSAQFFGRNILGAGVTVEDGARLTDCIIWDQARIGAGARLERVIVGCGGIVAEGSRPADGSIWA